MKKFVVCIIFVVGSLCAGRRPRTRLLSSKATSPSPERDSICEEKYAFYPMVGQCDAYFECINWKAEVKFCPDGLVFLPGTAYADYPCRYPADVSCAGRPQLQVPRPTRECPRQYGFFSSGDSTSCAEYRNCVDGVAYHLRCPEPLAYNPASYQCDWPDLVKECDAEAYLGVTCPRIETDDPVSYAHPKDCRKYYTCVQGRPRLQQCDLDQAFDDYTGRCVNKEDTVCVLV